MITIDNYIPVLQTIKNRADAYSNECASPHEKEFAEKCFQRERQSLSALPLSDDELRESAKLCKKWLDEFDEYNKSIGSSLQNLARAATGRCWGVKRSLTYLSRYSLDQLHQLRCLLVTLV